jgi:MscS family membrane protein
LVSEQTLDQVPFLYESVGSPALDRYFPSVLAETSFLGISLGRWLVLLLSLPLALLLGWTMSRCASWLWRIRKPSSLSVGRVNKTSLRKPIAMMLAILLHGVFVMLIGIPIYYRVYYFRLSAALLVLCIAWLGSRILDEAYKRGDLRTSSNSEIRSFLQLAHQLLRVSLFSLAVLFVLACLGIDTKAILAGVGIGGIALALGAQKTLENLFGGITLVMDKVFAVGDDCVISNRQVTVREIGLRSITMSTREGTEISFPNGTLAQNSIENLSRRTKFLISATVSVSYESKLAQFGEAIAQIRAMLSSHDRIEQKTARFCLSGLSSLGYEIELFAYVRGADIAEFSTIREEVLFRVLEILESFGATVAIPAQMNYVSRKPPTSKPETSETGSALESLQSGKGGSR